MQGWAQCLAGNWQRTHANHRKARRIVVGNCPRRNFGATPMRRALAAVFTMGVLAFPGFACAQDGPVMKRIADTKTITIGHRDASVPLSYLGPDGKVQGYSIDICLKIVDAAKEELKLDKIEVKFVPLTPQTRIPLLTAGTVDMICETSTHTLGRLRQVSFLNITFLT